MFINESSFAHGVTVWGAAMGRVCWQGALAVLAVWLICRVFPRLSPRHQCWLWRLAYLKFAIALFGVMPIDLPLLPPEPLLTLQAESAFPAVPPTGKVPFSTVESSLSTPLSPVPVALFGLWLIGCGWQGLAVMREGRKARTLFRRGQVVEDSALLRECRELCQQFGLRRPPQLRMYAGDGGPLLVGFLRPAILLPEALWSESTPAQRRLILAHELAHLRRDLLWAWVPTLGRCVLFFHPLVWLAEREWQQSQEMACDDQVLRLTAGSRSDYGAMLLKVALQPSPELPSGLMAMRVAESYTTVRRRLLAMKNARSASRRHLLTAGALIGALGIIGIVPWRVSAQDASRAEKEKAEKVRAFRESSSQAAISKKLIGALELNATQIDRIAAIYKRRDEQIDQMLTPEQRQRLLQGLNLKSNPMAQLDLSAVQKQQVVAIKQEAEARMRALKQDENLSREEKEKRMRDLEDSLKIRSDQLLTPDQRKKLELLKQQREQWDNPLKLTPEQEELAVKTKMDTGERMEALMKEQSLSEVEKKAQTEQLMREAHERFLQILTPEQRQQQSEREQSERELAEQGPYGLARLERLGNLNNAQKARVRTLYGNAEQQFDQVLTPAQKRKYRQLR